MIIELLFHNHKMQATHEGNQRRYRRMVKRGMLAAVVIQAELFINDSHERGCVHSDLGNQL